MSCGEVPIRERIANHPFGTDEHCATFRAANYGDDVKLYSTESGLSLDHAASDLIE